MRLSFAPFGYRLLVTQPCGLSRLALQEATKQVRESLVPDVLLVPRAAGRRIDYPAPW